MCHTLSGVCYTLTSRGNPTLHVRIDPLLRNGLRARAAARNVTVSRLVQFILGEYVKQVAEEKESTPAILRHLDTLVRIMRCQTQP